MVEPAVNHAVLSPVQEGPQGEQVVRLNGGWAAIHLPGEEGVVLVQYGRALLLESGHVVDLFHPGVAVSDEATLLCRGLHLFPDGRVESGEYGLVTSGSLPAGLQLLPAADDGFHRMCQAYEKTKRGG